MKNMTVHSRNQVTDKIDAIEVTCVELKPWGWRGFVDSELSAYKVAYEYRFDKHGVKVEYADGMGKWMITVFNAEAAGMGIDGAF